MSAVTIVLAYSSDGLRKLDVPSQTVDPGEQVRIYLWARSREELAGFRLDQGADNLGPGTLRQYPGQIEEQYFELAGDDALQSFDWPVTSLASVVAYGNLYANIDGAVSLVALPGEDVTRLFKLAGNDLARNVEADAPVLYGTVRARADRSPWCLEWRWTVPGVVAVSGDGYDFGRTPRFYFDASVVKASEGQLLTNLADRVGNLIMFSGFLRAWYVPELSADMGYEPFINNGSYGVWRSYNGKTTSWDGEIPDKAAFEYGCSTAYIISPNGKPCIRLLTEARKSKLRGLLWSGFGPYMIGHVPYATAMRRTIFIVWSGCPSYAIGASPVTNFIPSGYEPRERIRFEMGGDASDHDIDPQNIGAGPVGDVMSHLILQNMGGLYYDSGSAKEYATELTWNAWQNDINTDNVFYSSKKFPDADVNLVTIEIDAINKKLHIYKNGILAEDVIPTLGAVQANIFPVSFLKFDAYATFLNNEYDQMSEQYSTHMDVFTVLLFDGLFETSKRQAIEAYLMRKWGITA